MHTLFFFLSLLQIPQHTSIFSLPLFFLTEVNIVLRSQSILGVATIHDVTLQLTRFHQNVKFLILGYD